MSGDAGVKEGRSPLYVAAAAVVVFAVLLRVLGVNTGHVATLTTSVHPLYANVALSLLAAFMTNKLLKGFSPILIKAGMYGIDLSKDPTDPPTKVYAQSAHQACCCWPSVLRLNQRLLTFAGQSRAA